MIDTPSPSPRRPQPPAAALAPPPVDGRTKSAIIADSVRTRIVEGYLAPGERITLRMLAEEFDCSAIPAREAMRLLESDKLIIFVPHGGARVADVSVDDIIHLTEARALLEPEATCLAAQKIDHAGIERLEIMLGKMSSLSLADDGDGYSRLNRAFHSAILAHCPNRHLADLIDNLWDKAEWGRIVHRLDPGHTRVSLGQHEEIVAAIRAGELDRLRKVAIAHSRFGLQSLRRVLTRRR
ncbi:GntR family transcriptional regulator [Acuticoccus mangrovi]|uniref:GntR family transcriptional regulator n=1 Tax=Acuticoccus mangrovi TaxID=2796142 RepID=A0A934ILP1_9HYPH|nr:GntR family transcriptional regulator [Acuticoccus mangrovi]MBJ3774623.1 GntR family transcriptional regulator [Acuticoccus mangrovi]